MKSEIDYAQQARKTPQVSTFFRISIVETNLAGVRYLISISDLLYADTMLTVAPLYARRWRASKTNTMGCYVDITEGNHLKTIR